jgi:hypothetical protein
VNTELRIAGILCVILGLSLMFYNEMNAVTTSQGYETCQFGRNMTTHQFFPLDCSEVTTTDYPFDPRFNLVILFFGVGTLIWCEHENPNN